MDDTKTLDIGHRRFNFLACRFLLGASLLLIAYAAQASDGCAATFSHDAFDKTQSTRFAAVQVVPGLNVKTTIESLRTVAESDGFHIDRMDIGDNKGTLLFTQQGNGSSRSFPVMVAASSITQRVAIVAMLPAGMEAKPEDIRDNMCTMLARTQFTGARPGSTTLASTQAPDGSTGNSRTAPPSTEKSLNVLRPATNFDPAATKQALEEGTSVITGTACSVHSGQVNLARNQKVLLFPATAYLEDVINLMHKAKPGRDTIEWAPEAKATKLEGMTNEKGQFRFAKMKPGKYYLMTTLSTAIVKTRDVNVGTGVSGDVSVDIYQKQDYQLNYADMLETFVNVTKDGQTIDITLSPRRNWSLFRESGAAGIFGCRQL